MTGNKNALSGASPKGLEKGIVDGRNQHLQDKQNPRLEQYRDSPEQYRRAVRRLFAEAFIMSLDWPRRMRFYWCVDRNGCLRCSAADEGDVR
jgi:hypothetical protein